MAPRIGLVLDAMRARANTNSIDGAPAAHALVAVPIVSALVWTLATVALFAIAYGAISGVAGRRRTTRPAAAGK